MEFVHKFRLESHERVGFDANDKPWIKLAYVSVLTIFVSPLFGGIIGPLFIMLAVGINNRGVETEAREALNIGINVTIIGALLTCFSEIISAVSTTDARSILFGIFAAYVFISVVMGWRKTSREEAFRHPFIVRFINEPERR